MAALTPEKFKVIGYTEEDANRIDRPTISYWQDAWRRLRKNPIAMGSLVVLGILLVMVIIGPHIKGYDYVSMNIAEKNQGVSSKYWFGTDNLGRDLFSRVWVGARASLIIAIVATAIKLIIGTVYGALSVTAWCNTARQVRGMIKQLRETEYVYAAEVLGAKPLRIILKHYVPNMLGILILDTATAIPMFIFTEAGLSFLGIGLKAPSISLGVLISMGQQNMDFYPSQLLFPCLVLCIIVMAFNLLGDGLRDALDPRLRQ